MKTNDWKTLHTLRGRNPAKLNEQQKGIIELAEGMTRESALSDALRILLNSEHLREKAAASKAAVEDLMRGRENAKKSKSIEERLARLEALESLLDRFGLAGRSEPEIGALLQRGLHAGVESLTDPTRALDPDTMDLPTRPG